MNTVDWNVSWIDAAALVVAFLSLLYATRANWRNSALAEQNEDLRTRLTKLETAQEGTRKRASFKCCTTSARTLRRLFIENIGEGRALNLEIIANGVPAHEHPALKGASGVELNAPNLDVHPGSKLTLLCSFDPGTPDISPLTLKWRDQDGTPEEYTTALQDC